MRRDGWPNASVIKANAASLSWRFATSLDQYPDSSYPTVPVVPWDPRESVRSRQRLYSTGSATAVVSG